MSKRGIVYACSHLNYVAETLRSAKSARAHMPELHVELFCTPELLELGATEFHNIFSQIHVLDNVSFKHRPRFEACKISNLDEAIFIDGDTLFLSPCIELFDLLTNFDIALAIAPQLHHPSFIGSTAQNALPNISLALPEFNTGVMVVKNTDQFQSFIQDWEHYFAVCIENSYLMDQASFRIALARSTLRVATLPNNYNFRANVAQSVTSKVKIIHCHGELDLIASSINNTLAMRLYTPDSKLTHGFKPK